MIIFNRYLFKMLIFLRKKKLPCRGLFDTLKFLKVKLHIFQSRIQTNHMGNEPTMTITSYKLSWQRSPGQRSFTLFLFHSSYDCIFAALWLQTSHLKVWNIICKDKVVIFLQDVVMLQNAFKIWLPVMIQGGLIMLSVADFCIHIMKTLFIRTELLQSLNTLTVVSS